MLNNILGNLFIHRTYQISIKKQKQKYLEIGIQNSMQILKESSMCRIKY